MAWPIDPTAGLWLIIELYGWAFVIVIGGAVAVIAAVHLATELWRWLRGK